MFLPSLSIAFWSPLKLVDLNSRKEIQTTVDREKGQYLGHPTTALLPDGKTILCVYPKGHGKGEIVFKKSLDAGRTWSDRLPTPTSWRDSQEVPTIFQTIDAKGKRRLILFSGLFPAKRAISEDDGQTWTELEKVGDWGGIVVMSSLIPLPKRGSYLALFHDDGRFITSERKVTSPVTFTLYSSLSEDGGVTWQPPVPYFSSQAIHLCEPGAFPIPKTKSYGVLFRENSRRSESHLGIYDTRKGTWSDMKPVHRALTGDRHTAKWLKDGRLFITFRDMAEGSPWRGDWVAWIGTWEDIVNRREGQYRIRLMDNFDGADCGYPGVEILKDGTVVTTTYGHWVAGEQPYIVTVRLTPQLIKQELPDRGGKNKSAPFLWDRVRG